MKKILRWAVSAKILLAKTSILILININSKLKLPKIYIGEKTAFQPLLLRNSDSHMKKSETTPIPVK